MPLFGVHPGGHARTFRLLEGPGGQPDFAAGRRRGPVRHRLGDRLRQREAALNPLEPPPANKYYHTIRLPGAAASEVEVGQPTGTLRITRAKNVINVLLNGQLAAAGMLSPAGPLAGFEIQVVKAKSGTLSLTEFKIAR